MLRECQLRRDEKQQLWASALIGTPGFITAEPTVVSINPAHRLPADPAVLEPGCLLGTYCIDLQTRTRFRQNGTVASAEGGAVAMDVRVAFASCPKFIQGETAPQFSWIIQ